MLKAQVTRAQSHMTDQERANVSFEDIVRREIPLFIGRTCGIKFSQHALRQMLAVFENVLL